MDALRIESRRDGGVLELAWVARDRWRVALTLPDLQATTEADATARQGERTLAFLFGRISDDWRGWEGERTWSSLEGDFDIAASMDRAGHVALRVRIRSGPRDDDWLVDGVIWLDAGQLRDVARDAARFEGY